MRILVFLFIIFAYGQIYKNNIRVRFLNLTNVPLQIAGFYGKGRYGYGVLAVSNKNNSFEDALVFMTYFTPSNFIINRYVGQKNSTFPLTREIFNSTDPKEQLYLGNMNVNFFPIGYIISDLKYNFYINYTLFEEKFGNQFWVYAGINYNQRPNSPTDFQLRVDEQQLMYIDLTQNYPFYFIVTPYPRIETLHISVFFITLAFYFFIFLLLCIFSRWQPLRSRSSVPFLGCIAQFIFLFVDISQFFITLEQMRYYCLVLAIIQRPIIGIVVLITLLHFFRYVTIINMNQRKNAIIENKEEGGKVKLFFRILKVIGKWWVNVIIVIITFIIISGCSIILQLIVGVCLNDNTSNYSFALFLVLLFILFILVIIYDLVLNWKKIKTCDLLSFWKEDIFYLRFEIYFFAIGISFSYLIISNIILIPLQYEGIYNPLADRFSSSIMLFLLFWTQVLFPLLLTIIAKIRECCGKKVETDVILELLKDPDGNKIFHTFSKQEYSIENISCYDDIQKYKQENDPLQKKIMAKQIFDKYCNGSDSELEVNISMKIAIEIKDKMETGEVVKNLFDNLEISIILNLSDTFTRLIFTPEYRVYDLQKSYVNSAF